MNVYVVYKVIIQISLLLFRSKQFVVKRRFSDFLGFYEKFFEKYFQNGFIVFLFLEKSFIGMIKVKVGKEDFFFVEFFEKWRVVLERYFQRIVNYFIMLQDFDVREFLEKEELLCVVGIQILSGVGFFKMFNKVIDVVSKMIIKMNELDIWFEEKFQEVECEEQCLWKLYVVVEILVNYRKELVLNIVQFVKSLVMFGSFEDNMVLLWVFFQLVEVEEKIEQFYQEQVNNDFFFFVEFLSDYICFLVIVCVVFDQCMKIWQCWQDV